MQRTANVDEIQASAAFTADANIPDPRDISPANTVELWVIVTAFATFTSVDVPLLTSPFEIQENPTFPGDFSELGRIVGITDIGVFKKTFARENADSMGITAGAQIDVNGAGSITLSIRLVTKE